MHKVSIIANRLGIPSDSNRTETAIVAQMTVDQQAAIALFESLGFKAEALLRDHVRDIDGKTHDVVVLGHNIAQVQAQMEAYGLPGAVQH